MFKFSKTGGPPGLNLHLDPGIFHRCLLTLPCCFDTG